MDLSLMIAMLLVTTPSAVVLLVCMGVGGLLCPISSRAWHASMASRKLMKRAPSSSSTADYMKILIISEKLMTALLSGGSAASLDMKKWPPALLLDFYLKR